MSTSAANPDTARPQDKASRQSSPEADLGTAVAHTVAQLQAQFLSAHRPPSVVADLARLRRAVSGQPGTDPSIWQYTLAILPPALIARGTRDDEPTSWERVAHHTITLYALHQQSNGKRAHVVGLSLGGAAARYESSVGRQGALRRRLHAVGSARSESMRIYHLRGLIALLRSESVGLDYGLLARHLHRLSGNRDVINSVLLRWGRDYHRSAAIDFDSNDSLTSTSTED